MDIADSSAANPLQIRRIRRDLVVGDFQVQVGESEKFDTLRFVPLENTFDNPDVEPDNDCYCLEKPCLPSGLLDISGCQHGKASNWVL